MGRTKLVLAALAVMVAMLVVFSAPALADKNNNKNNHGDRNNNNGDVAFVVNDGFNRFHDDDINFRHGGDVEIDLDNDFGFDDGDHFFSGFSGFSPFFGLGCWEWSWVFERWEWECD
jgi:hypothetical protein